MTLDTGADLERERTVVVVDDEPLVRGLMIRGLEGAGFRVFGAGDGRAGFELVVAVEPDVVVTDLLMPVVDGWELAMMMRQHYPAIPMLFVSAVADEKAAGLPGECLVKPVLPQDLATRVRRMVETVEGVEESRGSRESQAR